METVPAAPCASPGPPIAVASGPAPAPATTPRDHGHHPPLRPTPSPENALQALLRAPGRRFAKLFLQWEGVNPSRKVVIMKARTPLAAASAVAMLLSIASTPLEAAIPPIWHLNGPESIYIGDSDPWVPDQSEPTGILHEPNRDSVVVGEGTSPAALPRELWKLQLIRILRILRLGGIVR